MNLSLGTLETRQSIFAFREASKVGSNLFAGKTVDVLDPQQGRDPVATFQRRVFNFGPGRTELNIQFTQWYNENAEKIAMEVKKKIGAQGSNFDLKASILKSKKFCELVKKIYFGAYLEDIKLTERDLQDIFKDVLFSEEIIRIASFDDLVHGLMITQGRIQILENALNAIKDKTDEEYLKIAEVYYDREIYEMAFKYFNILSNKDDIYILSKLARLYSAGLGCKMDLRKAIELSKRAFEIAPYHPILVKNLYTLYAQDGKEVISALYNTYSRLLADNRNVQEREEHYEDLKSAIAAFNVTISIGRATAVELRFAIEAYEKGVMGLVREIRTILFLKFRLKEIENPDQVQFVKNLKKLINIGVELSRVDLLIQHPKGDKIAGTLANGLIPSELYDHHIISTISCVDSSFVNSDKKRFANLLLSLCSTHRLSIDNCQFILNLMHLGISDEMILVFVKHGNVGWHYAKLYSQSNQIKRKYLQAVLFPYLKKRLNQLESKSIGPFLNITRIFEDPDASKWRLPIRRNDITNNQWFALGGNLELKMALLFDPQRDRQLLLNALQWFDKMPGTRDAKADLQMIRKRVASIVDYINQQDVDAETAKEVVKILGEGGTKCPDRASVALDEAEMYIKAFSKKDGAQYIINVIVNEFKRNIISAKFVDPNHRESIETYLYHLNLLNIPLGLESLTRGMLYSSVAMKTPLNKAMEVAYSVISEKNLIGFAQDHALMQMLFITDPEALEKFVQSIYDPEHGINFLPTDDIDKYTSRVNQFMSLASSIESLKELKTIIDCYYYTDKDILFETNPEKAIFLDNLIEVRLFKLLNDFKAEKIKMLLKDAGFMSNNTNYEYPMDSYWEI